MILANLLEKINTKNGNEILLIGKKNRDYEKTALIIGVFHGDEPDGEYLISRYLANAVASRNRLLFIPCLNPDGKSANTRTNANGVDLNRNLPTRNWELSEKNEYFGGNRPASEQETKFLVYVLEKYKPNVVLTLHEPYKIVNFDGGPKTQSKEIAKKIASVTGYKLQEDIGYPTPGSFGTYCGVEKNIPVITLELPENENKDTLWETNKGVFDYFASEY